MAIIYFAKAVFYMKGGRGTCTQVTSHTTRQGAGTSELGPFGYPVTPT